MTANKNRTKNESFIYLEQNVANFDQSNHLKFGKTKLKKFPDEVISLNIEFSGSTHKECTKGHDWLGSGYGPHVWHNVFNANVQIVFENAMHFMSDNYKYRVCCWLSGDSPEEVYLFSHYFHRQNLSESFTDSIDVRDIWNSSEGTKVCVEIHRAKIVDDVPIIKPQVLCQSSMSLFKLLQDQGSTENISICVSNSKFIVNKKILESKSPVFKAMFNNQMVENAMQSVHIEDFDVEIVEILLAYIYLGATKINHTNFIEIFRAAHRYEIKDLVRDCVEWIKFNVGRENFISCLRIAMLYELKDIEEGINRYIKSNEREFMQRKDYQSFLLEKIDLNAAISYLKLIHKYSSTHEFKIEVFKFLKDNINKMLDMVEFSRLFAEYPGLIQEVFHFIHCKSNNES